MSIQSRIIDMVKNKELTKEKALEKLTIYRELCIKYPWYSFLSEEEYQEAKAEIEKLVV